MDAMDKALEMGKTSATGSFHLLIGVAGSTIIMAVGTLILASLLSVPDLGLYGMAFIPSSMINYFRDWGMNSAMTQRIANLRATGRESEIHDVVLSGIVFELITGAVWALICFVIAEPLALILSPSNAADLSVYIAILSLSIFAGAIFAACNAIFVGYERMKFSSFSQILQAIVKTALGPFLIIIGFGVLGAVYAAVISILSGAVIGTLLAYFAFFKRLRKCKVGKCDVKATLKPMLSYGIPLSISSIVYGVLPQVFIFSMAVYAGSWMMGNYYAASYFSVLLTFISIPITTALFPAFSKLNPESDPETVRTVFASSVKYTALFLVPATMAIITLSTQLINTLFPSDGLLSSLFVVDAAPKFPNAGLFLALSSVLNLLVLIGNLSFGVFQSGIGKTNQIMKQSALSLVIGLPLAYLLVSYLNSVGGPAYAVIGGILGIFIANIPPVLWAIHWCWTKYRVKPDFVNSAKIFSAAAVASLVTFLFVDFLSLPYVVTLVSGSIVFLIIYLTAVAFIGAINKSDVDNLKAMFSGLGIISKILDLPLLFIQKLFEIKNGRIEKTPSKDMLNSSH